MSCVCVCVGGGSDWKEKCGGGGGGDYDDINLQHSWTPDSNKEMAKEAYPKPVCDSL